MRRSSWPAFFLTVCMAGPAAIAAHAAQSDMQTGPKMAPGLWHVTEAVENGRKTISFDECITPDVYNGTGLHGYLGQPPYFEQKISNEKRTATSLSFDFVRQGAQARESGSTQMSFPDDRHLINQEIATRITQTQTVKIAKHTTSVWLGPNCGNERPATLDELPRIPIQN